MQEQNLTEIWQVDVNGTIYEAAFSELGEWIGGGSLLPDDKVRKGNLRWIEAKRVPLLLPFFNAKQKGMPIPLFVTTTEAKSTGTASETVETQTNAPVSSVTLLSIPQMVSANDAVQVKPDVCLNHQDIESQFICDGCCIGLCRTCVKSYGASVRICIACGSMCRLVGEAQKVKKDEAKKIAAANAGFGFGDFGNAIAHPFKFKASLFFGALLFTFFSLGQSAAAIGGIFMFVSALFCLMLSNMLTFGVLSNTVDTFIQGNLDENFMPGFDDFSIWDDVLHPFFLSIGVYLSSFGPFLIIVIFGFYLVMNSVNSQIETFRSEIEKIPGTEVYAGRKLVDQSGDVKEILNGIKQKQSDRTEAATEMAEGNYNANVSSLTTDQQPPIDQDSKQQEELWAKATESRKKSLEATFGKTPETQAAEQSQMINALLSLSAPLVVVGFIALIWGLFFFPAACAVAGHSKSFVATINPLVGFDTIRRLGLTYVKILLMGLLLLIITAVVIMLLAAIFSPLALPGMGNLPAKMFGSMLTFYLWVVFSCILGYALFKSADKLGLQR